MGDDQALGRSRGGFGTKLHAVADALGLPIRLQLGPGQQNDMAPAPAMIADLPTGHLLADRAYDADNLMDVVYDNGGEPCIPPRRHRNHQHGYDRTLYKERNAIERMLNKLKQFRRVATRYDKRAANYLGFVKLAAAMLWLR